MMLLKLRLCLPVANRNMEIKVWGEGEKELLLLCQAKEATSGSCLKRLPAIGKNCGKFYSEKEKNRFLDKNQG